MDGMAASWQRGEREGARESYQVHTKKKFVSFCKVEREGPRKGRERERERTRTKWKHVSLCSFLRGLTCSG